MAIALKASGKSSMSQVLRMEPRGHDDRVSQALALEAGTIVRPGQTGNRLDLRHRQPFGRRDFQGRKVFSSRSNYQARPVVPLARRHSVRVRFRVSTENDPSLPNSVLALSISRRLSSGAAISAVISTTA